MTVLGSGTAPGGKLRLAAQLPGGEQLSSISDYQLAAAEKAGVEFRLGAPADAAAILALAPDAVVVATGATMIRPRWLPAEAAAWAPDLRSALPGLLALRGSQPGTAVLFDQDHTDSTYAAVELLHRRFARVVLVTPRESIAQDCWLVTRQGILRRLHRLGTTLLTATEPVWNDAPAEGRLDCANVHTGAIASIDNLACFTWSTPRAPQDALAAPLRAAGIAVHIVGDARNARGAMAATAEGHAAGRAI